MSAITHRHFSSLGQHLLGRSLNLVGRAGSAAASPPQAPGWIDRLAAWSDRQAPRQHRLGSYTRLI